MSIKESKNKRKEVIHFYLSTAIDYPSAIPHAGHLYEKILADTIARWKRLQGYNVHFSTGLDEHGLKIQRKAEEAGKTPQKFVDEMSKYFLELCKIYNISYDDFIRTTEKRHEIVVKKFLTILQKKNYIYRGSYKGPYCVECETFYTEKDLIDEKCPVHKKEAKITTEEGYFFKMSTFQDKLINYIQKKQDFIVLEKKRNEILNRLKEPLKDLSITRKDVWGLEFPFDKKYSIAVWNEALINYLTTIDYPKKKFKDFWPALHIIGPEIVWHHTVIWGAMLLAAGLELPSVLTHGWINLKGEKMSKSLGNVIDPFELAKKYPADGIRYFLLREIPFGENGDFSEKALISRINDELANNLGNLISRTLSMSEKYFGSNVPKGKNNLKLNFNPVFSAMENFQLHVAIQEVFKLVAGINRYIAETKPWEVKKRDYIIYTVLDSIRQISIVLSAFLPATSQRIQQALGLKNLDFKDLKNNLLKPGSSLQKSFILFAKIESEKPTLINKKKIEGVMTNISLQEFQKAELITGRILETQDHPKADKLYVLKVDIGEKKIQLVAGIKSFYTKKELQGKTIIVVKNLEPAELRGIKSEGMLLAAEKDGKIVLLSTEKEIGTGAKIG